jgi:hypothetical protein
MSATFVLSILIGLDKGKLIGTEDHALIEHDCTTAPWFELIDDMLKEEDLDHARLK